MEITKESDRFTVNENGEELGFISFIEEDDVMTIDHTEVSPQLKGQGAGKKLVERAVQHARDEGKKVIPQCAFAKSVIEQNPEFQDVLAG
ncbi:GNAT family N-acetyltransferase [Planomicrobium sp. YIM 101495]|uniref:GNAT family N-acetyltransferase n=1 Tax=Planomicrobium sp. YIM 101495 TaxID=2665160 RepID=UPI0012B9AB9D|nr:GNAT family N-acetyltransferase [Planomicrobium sp. YIM 101495]MTD31438.1 GNAT family N-acetyltransferase [Planomicrobium sp. YIM 101495]